MRKIIFLLTLIFISFLSFSQNITTPIAQKGVIDLRNWNFEDGNVPLKGEWEFYWKKFLTPEDFQRQTYSPDAYMNVPGSWDYVEGFSDTGFATYRLVIFVKPDTQKYSIYFEEVLSSYKAFWNSFPLPEVGKVAKCSTCGYEPKVYIQITNVDFNTEKIQLIVQVANFSHRDAGLIRAPILGKEQNIQKSFLSTVIIDILVFGAILIMAFYHLGIYFFRRKTVSALAFSLFLILAALRILFTNNYIFTFFDHNVSWNTVYRIAYFTFYALVAAFTLFIQSIFEDKHKWVFYSAYIISFAYILTLFLPPIVFTKLLIGFQLATFIFIGFLIYVMIKNIIAKKAGAVILFITILLFFAAGINDILFFNGVIKSVELSHIGTFILILGQSLTLAKIFTNAFIQNENLTIELNYQKEHLEDLVKERTKQIEQQNEELIIQREEIEKQKELLEFHNKVITDSINYAATIQTAILPVSENITKLFEAFIIYLPKDIVSGDFYWFYYKQKDFVYFAIGDCTGHGVPAAFLSIIGSYQLHYILTEKNVLEPDKIIFMMHEAFKQFFKNSKFKQNGIDLLLMRFDKKQMNKVDYASARIDLFYFDSQQDNILRFKGDKFTVGVDYLNVGKIVLHSLNLKDDDILYLTTDGFKDQNNPNRERFGTVRFMDMLKEYAKMPFEQQKIKIIETLENFKQGEPQRDDITIIGLKLKYKIFPSDLFND